MDDPAAVEDPQEDAPCDQPPERPHRRLPRYLAATAATVVAVDQATKAWMVELLQGRDPVQLVPGLLQLRLVRNPGAAFSFATGTTWVFTVIAIVVSVVIIRIARTLGSGWWTLALGLMLGGALGNLVDRLLRSPGIGRGHVVDFVELPDFPVFNVADSCLTTAAVLVVWLGIRGIGVDGRRVGD
ncbi:MAG: signal peptidase II [Actinomycetales bacterium]|nr:signal peptidase II [Actinomycetales bacterium]